ncbi:bacteriocin [Enterococcus plantarum]|uniref:Bacteriocin n=1 Tax=Enterococcus plantarum TaxID=1077675 RepID=A0A2W3ZS85_9ENTE|nr:bacteriocin [Enterococcus plantarum]
MHLIKEKKVRTLNDKELQNVYGGAKWGWLGWVEPVGEFLGGFVKGVQKEGNRNKWKNV